MKKSPAAASPGILDGPSTPERARLRASFRTLQERSAERRLALYRLYRAARGDPKLQAKVLRRHGMKDVAEFWDSATLTPLADDWRKRTCYGEPLGKSEHALLGGLGSSLERFPVALGGFGILAPEVAIDPRVVPRGFRCVALTGFLRPAEDGLVESLPDAKLAEEVLVRIRLGATKREIDDWLEDLMEWIREVRKSSEGCKPLEMGRSGQMPVKDNPDLLAAIWIRKTELLAGGKNKKVRLPDVFEQVVPRAPRELRLGNLQQHVRKLVRLHAAACDLRESLDPRMVDPISERIAGRIPPVETMDGIRNAFRRLKLAPPAKAEIEQIRRRFLFKELSTVRSWDRVVRGQDMGEMRRFYPYIFPREQRATEAEQKDDRNSLEKVVARLKGRSPWSLV